MKSYIVLFFIGVPFLFFGQKSEGLSFVSTTYNFGTISSNSLLKAEFLFTNTSDLPVEIIKIHGDNDCIEIDTSSYRNYKPEEKGVITVIYNASCKGHIRRTLSVFTSNKNNTVSLKLTGKIND